MLGRDVGLLPCRGLDHFFCHPSQDIRGIEQLVRGVGDDMRELADSIPEFGETLRRTASERHPLTQSG